MSPEISISLLIFVAAILIETYHINKNKSFLQTCTVTGRCPTGRAALLARTASAALLPDLRAPSSVVNPDDLRTHTAPVTAVLAVQSCLAGPS